MHIAAPWMLLLLDIATPTPNPIDSAEDGLHVMQFEGSEGKSLIVELSDGLALVELPIHDAGGGPQALVDRKDGGYQALRTLKTKFPKKPLKYVLSSHWHPHSLSAMVPWIDAGATLVTTRANFERLKTMSTPKTLQRAKIQFVDGESMTFGQGRDAITAYRLEKSKYSSIPTKDYLLFSVAGGKVLHIGCMYGPRTRPVVKGQPVVSRRQLDIHAFLTDAPKSITQLVRYQQEASTHQTFIPTTELHHLIRTGITGKELAAPYQAMSTEQLLLAQDQHITQALTDGIPGVLFNGLVFETLGQKQFDRALQFAKLQTHINPTDPNAWDTLGEVYFLMGNTSVARVYEKMSQQLDPEFSGGVKMWEKDLEQLEQQWAKSDIDDKKRKASPDPSARRE